MTNTQFVQNVLTIAATQPTYREGGTGADGTCDCIGLIMGALKRTFPMHSTNYFARYEMDLLEPLTGVDQLHPGDLVYKARTDTSTLNDRYQPGGRYYTGDLLDYYHVGVVTAVTPLTITHCTSTGNVDGIATDGSIKGWTHVGAVDGIEYNDEIEDPPNITTAIVTAPSGTTVNMRSRPDKNSPVLHKVPVGATVSIRTQAAGWAQILYANAVGYMMSEYLQTGAAPEQSADVVNITLPRAAAQALKTALNNMTL